MKKSFSLWIYFLILSSVSTAQTPKTGVPESYRAEWAAIRSGLDENIEKYRKREAIIEFVDKEGKPIQHAMVSVQQKTHAFNFGCNILVLGQLGELNETYERTFTRLFNFATTTFTWGALEPEKGRMRFAEGSEEVWRRPPPDRVVAFGKKYGISLQGQPLMCDHWHPAWDTTGLNQVKRHYKEWFSKVAKRYGKDIKYWHVVNESFSWASRAKKSIENGDWVFPLTTTDLKYVYWAFKQAKRYFPEDNLLILNDGTDFNNPVDGGDARYQNVFPVGNGNRFYQLSKSLVEKRVGLEGIGLQFHLMSNSALQSHLNGKAFPPYKLLENYRKFSELGLPMFITEITIPATLGGHAEGEAIQAEVISNLYRLWFSIPMMNAIIYWNLPDGAAWKNEGQVKAGLLDEYFSEKPAYQALYQLIQREWKTRLTMESDSQGKVKFRGFFGQYEIIVTSGDKSLTYDMDLLKEPLKTNRFVFK